MIWLLPHPHSHQQVVSLSRSSCVSPVELLTGYGGRGGGGEAKSNDREKAWSSINHSILSGGIFLPHKVHNTGKGAPVTSDALIRSSRKLRERSFSPTREHMVTPRSVLRPFFIRFISIPSTFKAFCTELHSLAA